MSLEDLVLYDVDEEAGSCRLTLNRPDKRNALSPNLLRALVTAFARAKEDDRATVVVITGAGDKVFCAGGDLSGSAAGPWAMHQERELFIDVLEAMFALGKPIIGRINGHALGGGFGLTLACDVAVAADNATFGTPEVRVGLFPMMIMTLIFRNIGRKRAMEMMLSGERVDAQEALAMGAINKVVPAADLDEATGAMVGRIARFSPAVLKLGRDAVYQTMDMSMSEGLQFLRSQLTVNTMLEDAAEGITAFITKREPEWKGR